MTHDPLRGLLPSTQQVRIHSNDIDKDIEVRLGHDPVLLMAPPACRWPSA